MLSEVIYKRNRVFYTSDCIKSARIEKYNFDKTLNDHCSNHIQNEDDDVSDKQLENFGAETLFSDQPEPVTGELRAYVLNIWEKSLMKEHYKRTCTGLLEKYGGLSLYDIDFESIYYIGDEDI